MAVKKVILKKNSSKKSTAKTVSNKTKTKTTKKVVAKTKTIKKSVKKVPVKKVTKKVNTKVTKKAVKKISKPVKKVVAKKSSKSKDPSKPAYKPKAFTIRTKPKKEGEKKEEKKISTKEQLAEELINKGKERGFVTYDEIIKYFPTIETDIVFLEELYERLSVAKVDVLESGNILNLDDDLKGGKEENAHDSIQIYLREIGQYPLIGGEEEKMLAQRIAEGDEEAKNILAKSNLRQIGRAHV